MDQKRAVFSSIEEYIAAFPAEIQAKLREMRAAIHAAAPEAQERISYQMPTFYLQGNLVHFAAFKHHIGLYPMPGAITAFQKELSGFVSSKGAVQFPLDRPLPLDLVSQIVRFRVAENLRKAEEKKAGRK